MVSPGGESQSGVNGAFASVMVVSDEDNADASDARPVEASVRTTGNWVVVRLEHEPPAALQIKGELPGAVPCQGVRATRDELGDAGGRLQVGQSGPKLSGTGRPELLRRDSPALTQVAKPLVR